MYENTQETAKKIIPLWLKYSDAFGWDDIFWSLIGAHVFFFPKWQALSHVSSSIINSRGCTCYPHCPIIFSRVPCYHKTINSIKHRQLQLVLTNTLLQLLNYVIIGNIKKWQRTKRWRNRNSCHTGLAFVLRDDKEPTVFSLAGPGVLRPWQTHHNLALKAWAISSK